MKILQFIFVEPWPWWLGGIIIGLLVPAMYYFLNTALGVSTGYGNIAKMIFPKTKLKWLNSDKFKDIFNWRFFFISGIIIGGFISARLSGGRLLIIDMGIFTQSLNWPYIAYMGWFLLGGILLGLGSRIAGGCTSGHSIHGIANLHPSSMLSTFFFLLLGAITVNAIRIFILGGV